MVGPDGAIFDRYRNGVSLEVVVFWQALTLNARQAIGTLPGRQFGYSGERHLWGPVPVSVEEPLRRYRVPDR